MRLMKKWIMNLVNLISMCLIVLAVFVLFTVVMTKSGEAPEVFGYSVFRVLTGSMEPGIPEDSLILVKRMGPEAIRSGDVISYYSTDPELNGAVNTHRVVSVEQEEGQYRFITKGDANAVEDEYPAAGKSLLGKVVFVSYPLGIAVNFLSSPVGFFALIVFPLLIILIMNLYRTIRSARRIMREEKEEAIRRAVEEVRQRKLMERAQMEREQREREEEETHSSF